MKLTYYAESPNFGDMLNPHIFNHFLPGFFDADESTQFLGIGSTLGILLPSRITRKQIVFSSGFAYGNPPDDLSRHEFWCVRGPETARVLNLPEDVVRGDGALLLKQMEHPPVEKVFDRSFMPHEFGHVHYPGWRTLAESLGMHYISPYDPVDKIITEIRQTRVLLTESMHGAIVADVFRIPWVALKLNARTNDFKWLDWTRSMDVALGMKTLPELNALSQQIWKVKYKLQTKGIRLGPLASLMAMVYHTGVTPARKYRVRKRLAELSKEAGQLSAEKVVLEKSGQLLDRLMQVGKRYG